MSEDQALVVIERKDAYATFTTEGGVLPIIEKLRAHAANAPTNVVSLRGRKEIAAYAYKFATSKTFLEGIGKELADEQKAIPKKIDAARKMLKDTCDELRDQVRRPLDEWEAAEGARVKAHQEHIARLIALRTPPADLRAETLFALVEDARSIDDGPACEEFQGETEREKSLTVDTLLALFEQRKSFEADQAELAELRKMKAERDAAEAKAAAERAEAERLAEFERESADRARAAAEIAVRAEQERAEASAKAAQEAQERRERELQAAAAESERKAQAAIAEAAATEARLKREAEQAKLAEEAETRRREANKEHAAKINRAIVAALIEGCAFINDGLSESTARAIVKHIALGNVPNCKITY